MANTDIIYSYPTTEAGLSLRTQAVAWAYSDWKPIAKVISQNINIVGFNYQLTLVMSADTTYEHIFEIGVNYGSGIVTRVQIPASDRNDTAVGFYMPNKSIYLPEPYLVYQGASIYMRVAGSVASAKTYNGIKIRYQATAQNKSELYQGVSNNYQFIEVGNGMSAGERIQ